MSGCVLLHQTPPKRARTCRSAGAEQRRFWLQQTGGDGWRGGMMEGGPGPLPMQKCLSLPGSGVLAAPSSTHAAGALLHSHRLHLSRPFKVAPTFRRRRGGRWGVKSRAEAGSGMETSLKEGEQRASEAGRGRRLKGAVAFRLCWERRKTQPLAGGAGECV